MIPGGPSLDQLSPSSVPHPTTATAALPAISSHGHHSTTSFSSSSSPSSSSSSSSSSPKTFTVSEIQQLLLDPDTKAQAHLDALTGSPSIYLSQLRTMIDRSVLVTLSSVSRARILAALLRSKQTSMLSHYLSIQGLIGLGEVLKAVQLLDAERLSRQLYKKLALLESRKSEDDKSVKKSTLSKIRLAAHNALQESIAGGSMSGSRCKVIKRWVRSLPPQILEFWALHFPTDSFKLLSDIVHLSPKDFALPYFLPYIYGQTPPTDSLLYIANNLTVDTLEEALRKHERLSSLYSFLRKKFKENREALNAQEEEIADMMSMGFTRNQCLAARAFGGRDSASRADWLLENADRASSMHVEDAAQRSDISTGAKILLAQLAPLDELIWWYHEIGNSDMERIISQRLSSGEELPINARSSYGKLMERLLYFREKNISFAPLLLPWADRRLNEIKQMYSTSFSSAARSSGSSVSVAVLGDASGSMQVAIKCACSLSSLLSVCLDADLSLFAETSFAPPVLPRTASEVVLVSERVRATGGTSMASALWPYYANKKRIDMFVLVSDEGENREFEGYTFARLWRRYIEEVHPVSKVVLVSFLEVGEKGLIKDRMEVEGFNVRQFRFDKDRPDTSKFDAIVGLVTLETQVFMDRFTQINQCLCEGEDSPNLPGAIRDLVMEY